MAQKYEYYASLVRCTNCDKLFPYESWKNRSMCMECTQAALEFKEEPAEMDRTKEWE